MSSAYKGKSEACSSHEDEGVAKLIALSCREMSCVYELPSTWWHAGINVLKHKRGESETAA